MLQGHVFFFKLSKIGEFCLPRTKHEGDTNFKTKIKKELQYLEEKGQFVSKPFTTEFS